MGEIEIQVNGVTPIGHLGVQPWMEAPSLQAVVRALTAGGAEIRYVGGCVRDSLAGRPIGDIDIATPDPPEKTMEKLEAAGLKAVPTGIAHGTVTAVSNGRPFEITTLRKDVKTDGRHAVVDFTDNWIEDAARRDFTFNALSASVTGEVYDPFGGIDDLAKGRVRFVGRAQDRIEEDVLRILRFFRFYAYYGHGHPDRDALFACRHHAKKIENLSGERVRNEFLKLLLAPDPVSALTYMREATLEVVLPQANDFGPLRALTWLETTAIKYETVNPDGLRRLAALLRGGEPDAETVAERFRLSNQDRERLRQMVLPAEPFLIASPSENQRLAALYRHGPERTRDLALLAWASEVSQHAKLPREETEGWIATIEATEQTQVPDFPLTGKDALKAGLTAGPSLGQALSQVEDWWLEGGCRSSKADCLNRLLEIAGGPENDDP